MVDELSMEIAENFIAGRDREVRRFALSAAGNGSMIVAIALTLFERGGIDLVRKFHATLERAEDENPPSVPCW